MLRAILYDNAQVVSSLLSGLTDYYTDDRGDVGSWVRVAAMEGLTAFVPLAMRMGVGCVGVLTPILYKGRIVYLSHTYMYIPLVLSFSASPLLSLHLFFTPVTVY